MLRRSAYSAALREFLSAPDNEVLGVLVSAQHGEVTPQQRDAWLRQIDLLKLCLANRSNGHIFFEYLIPRIGRRADVVLVVSNVVVILEFKVGSAKFVAADMVQTFDYALDLKNFHEGCHTVVLAPVLVATDAKPPLLGNKISDDLIVEISCVGNGGISAAIERALEFGRGEAIDAVTWADSIYRPTPTIVEASQALFRGHSVVEISRSEAGADNLGATTARLNTIIDRAKSRGEKAICVVTGVPGAGKTLAGLNLACERRRSDADDEEHAVFLSGNGPLVKVLREALARDAVDQAKLRGEKLTKSNAKREADTFIQNVHHFRDDALLTEMAPVERVVVFDEAQRAWDVDQTSKFMNQKRGQQGFDLSEPEFLIGVMDRHVGWAVIVCLVGGGQELNTGEGGLEEWLRALRDRYNRWNIYVPQGDKIQDYLPSFSLDELGTRGRQEEELHLGVSLRSFRSEQLSEVVRFLLEGSAERTRILIEKLGARYPIRITRDLETAKDWVRARARGSERCGLLASSGARRLKPLGVYPSGIRGKECEWFLNEATDVRSSIYLEDAATEFEVQGLEVDWSVVCWGGDLTREKDTWNFRNFKGTKWTQIRGDLDQRYKLNSYRVLMTRARQGMVIFVPTGDPADSTRDPEMYDSVWNYLCNCNLQKAGESA